MKIALAVFALVIALFCGLDRYAHPSGVRFSSAKVYTSFSAPEWGAPSLTASEQSEVDKVLRQPFTYLGKGSQSHVFISADRKYVLKFFKQNKWTPRTWLALIPFSFNPLYQEYLLLKEKQRRTFHACKLAFTDFKKETGLVYIHLNKTENLKKVIAVSDKKGKPHKISLDETSFVIQKKADLLYPRITELMGRKDIAGAKKVISSLFALLFTLNKKGVVDNDPILRKNFGLIDDVAVQIDVGRMYIDPDRVGNNRSENVAFVSTSFKKWLTGNYPELLPCFEECLQQ